MDCPNTNNYDLIVAADGSNSNTKKKLKTPSFNFNYDQMCITTKVLLRGVKSNEAFEILNSEGPFAVLPLGGDLFQIICSQSLENGTYNMSLPKSLFLDYLSTILPYGIEPDSIIDEPKSFSINFLLFEHLYIAVLSFVGSFFRPDSGRGYISNPIENIFNWIAVVL